MHVRNVRGQNVANVVYIEPTISLAFLEDREEGLQ